MTGILFFCSMTRHCLFHSGGYDLGIFDQAVYLLSQGERPFSTIRGIHILGDHAAIILYPISFLYQIWPAVAWLLGLQALALASGGWLTYQVAKQTGLADQTALMMAIVYLTYPAIFNINLFDFHPEVMAVPALLGAVWSIRSGSILRFLGCVIWVLSCKAVLALTVVALGLWIVIWQAPRLSEKVRVKVRNTGWIAVGMGCFWFALTAFWLIPAFSGAAPAAVSSYAYLGASVTEIALHLILKPQLMLGKIISLETLAYLFLLVIPILWGLSWRSWDPLVPALPTLGLNILSTHSAYRDLVHHYSLPVIPFLIVMVTDNLSAQRTWTSSRKLIVIWSLISFLALAKYGYFGSLYLAHLNSWSATRLALQRVDPIGGVLTTHEISPHLTHRPVIVFTDQEDPVQDWDPFEFVLLNRSNPGWRSSPEYVEALLADIAASELFTPLFEQDQVILFGKISS
ncbi:MAG: DUF2079 domain-containing protein [Synechococcaceae cyanobacterium SM2_3_2]|nr:DUF2079 domain-containing protein [Synechococcaceae cyanobacterium SM2_3_2]